MEKPEYKIGDIVIYIGFLGYIKQGVIRSAIYFTEEDVFFGKGWRYYVSSRANSWIVEQKKIISKA